MTETNTKLTPIEAINEFYKLKSKYETGYYEKYVKPIIVCNQSKREKRVAYSKLPKHECINCKRNVGTIWDIKSVHTDDIKYYKAKCGDLENPCPLDIQINYSFRELMDKSISTGLSQIENIKMEIIKEKNNALFFNKDVVDLFDTLTEDLKLETEHTGYVIETNILKNDNPDKKMALKQTINEFGKEFVLPFKQMVKEYFETDNEIILNNAVSFYVNEMLPKLREIQVLKYDINAIEFDEDTNIYTLIQRPNSLESNEFYYKNEDAVIKFAKGVKQEKQKTRKSGVKITKTKTRKIKPVAELVLEEDEEEQDL